MTYEHNSYLLHTCFPKFQWKLCDSPESYSFYTELEGEHAGVSLHVAWWEDSHQWAGFTRGLHPDHEELLETCYTLVSAVRLLIAHYNLVSLRRCKGLFYYDDPFPGWEDEDNDDD